MDNVAHRHTPLAGFAEQLEAASDIPGRIRLTEVRFLTQLTLRVAPGTEAARAACRALGVALPTAPNTTCANGEVEVIWMGPDEWLVVAPADGDALRSALEDALEGEYASEFGASRTRKRIRASGFASVIDVSAQRTVIEVAGADARDVLLKGCALDLHPRAFGAGACAQTLLARAHVILIARSDEPAFWVFVRASFAEYLAEWLIDASAEYRGATPLDLSHRSTDFSTRVAA